MSNYILSERLMIRQWRQSDHDALLAIADQLYVNQWLPDWYGWDRWGHDWIDRVNRHYQTDDPMKEFLGYAITLKSGTVIGYIGISSFEDREPGIGYFIDEHYSNQGYITEALIAFTNHVFEKYGYTHIIATVQPANFSSNAVLKKAEFKLISTIEILDDGQTEVLPFHYYRLDNPNARN